MIFFFRKGLWSMHFLKLHFFKKLSLTEKNYHVHRILKRNLHFASLIILKFKKSENRNNDYPFVKYFFSFLLSIEMNFKIPILETVKHLIILTKIVTRFRGSPYFQYFSWKNVVICYAERMKNLLLLLTDINCRIPLAERERY